MPKLTIATTAICLLIIGLFANLSPAQAAKKRATAVSPPAGLRVVGNELRNAAGAQVRLRGFNVSGTEYACWQGWGIFDAPTTDSAIQAIKSWKANTVNVSLNESCWLGVNGVPTTYSGATYRRAITDYVNRLTAQGLMVNLRMSWITSGVPDMADRQYAPDFWRSVATTFKDNPSVLFDLVAEPHPDGGRDTDAAWRCWRDGGTCPGLSYAAAGMQELVSAVRSTGATNVLVLTGVSWGNSVTRWLANRPSDPLNNLAAGIHIYKFNVCSTPACWDQRVAPVAANVPLIGTEIGEDNNASTSDGTYTPTLMTWLDNHNASYIVWTWNRWNNYALNLISDWNGTPTAPYGVAIRNHFLK